MFAYSGKWMDYAIFYPDIDEEGYDGVHHGGVKGIRDDAPEEIKKAYERDIEIIRKAEAMGIML